MQYRTVSHIGGLEPQTAGRALCNVVVSRRVHRLGLKETVNRSLSPLREIRREKGEDEENENSQDVAPHILTSNARRQRRRQRQTSRYCPEKCVVIHRFDAT